MRLYYQTERESGPVHSSELGFGAQILRWISATLIEQWENYLKRQASRHLANEMKSRACTYPTLRAMCSDAAVKPSCFIVRSTLATVSCCPTSVRLSQNKKNSKRNKNKSCPRSNDEPRWPAAFRTRPGSLKKNKNRNTKTKEEEEEEEEEERKKEKKNEDMKTRRKRRRRTTTRRTRTRTRKQNNSRNKRSITGRTEEKLKKRNRK